MAKTILLISYHFPPSPAIGGQRAANFARYLPAHGWDVEVLTIDDRYLSDRDEARLHGLEELTIHKTGKLPRLRGLYSFAKQQFKRLGKGRAGREIGGGWAAVERRRQAGDGTADEPLGQRLKRYYASLFLALPDFERNWVIPATVRAVGLVRRKKIDVILTSCPPYSVHLVGLLVNMFTGVRWVADFRDPWYVASRKIMYPTCRLSRAIEGLMERQVMRRSALVLCNTERLRATLADHYRELKRDGFHFIPNGISTDVFRRLDGLEKYQIFTITYTGSLYFQRTPEPLFQALANLLVQDGGDRHAFRLKLVGQCDRVEGVPTTELVRAFGLEGCVEVHPPVPYLESLEMIGKSHLALLLAPNQPYQIPAKVYDYMGCGTPILALAGEGATADIIAETGTGRVFHPDDVVSLTAFLGQCLEIAPQIAAEHTARVREAFDRQKVTARLAAMLDGSGV